MSLVLKIKRSSRSSCYGGIGPVLSVACLLLLTIIPNPVWCFADETETPKATQTSTQATPARETTEKPKPDVKAKKLDLGVLDKLPDDSRSGKADAMPEPPFPLPAEETSGKKKSDGKDGVKEKEGGDDEESASYLSKMSQQEREEAIREVERLIEEERKAWEEQEAREAAAPPLVDDPAKLVPLDPVARIWIERDEKNERKSVVVLGVVVLREGPLELFACRRRSKEHESIVALNVKPYLIHAGLLLTGAKPGKPVEFTPKFVPPTGDTIDVRVRWLDANGKRHECPAQDWIAEAGEFDEVKQKDGSVKKSKRSMQTHWVFTGSMTYKDEEGISHYIADETGEIIGTSNFVGAILDVPIESSDRNELLMFEPYTERIPKVGTPVTLILRRVVPEKEGKDKASNSETVAPAKQDVPPAKSENTPSKEETAVPTITSPASSETASPAESLPTAPLADPASSPKP